MRLSLDIFNTWNILTLKCIALSSRWPIVSLSRILTFVSPPFRGLLSVGHGCKKLRNLTLTDCAFVTDKGLGAIAIGCKELTHLEVNGCHNIGTTGLESVGKYCMYTSYISSDNY